MDVLELIEGQLIANRLPIVAVTLTAVPLANTPVILALHWHGFVEVQLAECSQPVAFQSVPSSVLQVNSHWDRCHDLDNALLEAAWELGAWNLERAQVAPFMRPGADCAEATFAQHAFGKSTVFVEEQSPFVADAPDVDELIDMAGRTGYVQWLFRPVRGGLWQAPLDDVTLEAGGYRNPVCPLVGKPLVEAHRLTKSRREVYSLGRSVSVLH